MTSAFSFNPQTIRSYFFAERKPLFRVTISGLINNIGLALPS